MPNRWLKASLLTSDRFNGVSFAAQSVFTRLLLIVDDHGRYDGRVPVLLSACDPLQTFARRCPQMSADGIQDWFKSVLAELEEADLVRFWGSMKGPFLLIPRFYERARSKSRFPEPPGELLAEQGCTHLLADARKCELSTSTSTSTSTVHDHGTRPRTTEGQKRSTGASHRSPSNGAPTSQTWEAYSVSYLQRYGTKPVRNATVNGQLAHLVGRLGAEEAPRVAAFFLTHNNAYYVKKGHPIGLLLQDAEKLRTEWATDRKITGLEARSAEEKDAVAEQVRRVSANLERTENETY